VGGGFCRHGGDPGRHREFDAGIARQVVGLRHLKIQNRGAGMDKCERMYFALSTLAVWIVGIN
jgi:hypothetical protein